MMMPRKFPHTRQFVDEIELEETCKVAGCKNPPVPLEKLDDYAKQFSYIIGFCKYHFHRPNRYKRKELPQKDVAEIYWKYCEGRGIYGLAKEYYTWPRIIKKIIRQNHFEMPRRRKSAISTEKHVRKRTTEDREWRYSVLSRDNYTCQGKADEHHSQLHAHHIKSYAKYPELRYDVNNGITLCRSCHIKEHSWLQKLYP